MLSIVDSCNIRDKAIRVAQLLLKEKGIDTICVDTIDGIGDAEIERNFDEVVRELVNDTMFHEDEW